jgi:hypothetical protein
MSRKDFCLDNHQNECYVITMNMHAVKREEVITKNLKLARKDIAYLKFIIEGYEGMALLTTVEKYEAIIQLTVTPDFISEIDLLLQALKDEINFYEIEK